jgi:hypothetical protein
MESKRRFGDRKDGRLIQSLAPFYKFMPYIMPTKNDACNQFEDCIEITNTDRWLRQKRLEGYKGLGYLHLFIAAYIRMVSMRPGINRFVAGRRIYARNNIEVVLTVRRSMSTTSNETTIKAVFAPTDTIFDVYRKMNEKIDEIKYGDQDNNTEQVAGALLKLPRFLLRFAIGCLRVMDYFGIIPQKLLDASPFHGSMIITDMGSLGIPPIYSCLFLVLLAAVIVLRKNASVRVLDLLVPIMAGIYIILTLFLIIVNFRQLPGVFARVFEEALGLRQAIAGGFGAVLMNGVKRGLFSNEAGSGSAPCAAATAETSHPAKVGLMQAMGVFIDTLLCTCTAMIMLLVPADKISGLEGMDLLQAAMSWHFGELGVIFIAVILWLFSFTTFIGILFYARSNVSYLFGDTWAAQTAYKILALIMMFVGGLTAYTFVWDLGDVGVGLMTVFNLIALIPMSKEALVSLRDYEAKYKKS